MAHPIRDKIPFLVASFDKLLNWREAIRFGLRNLV